MFNYKAKKITQGYDLSGSSISPCYNLNGESCEIPSFTLKVMEYNVGQWYLGNHDNVPSELDSTYYDLQNGMIQNANADIAFLCEYVKTFSKTGRTALSMLSQHFPYVYERAGTSVTIGAYCAICSKYPITNYQHNVYTSDNSMYYDTCQITVNGVPIQLVVTHLIYNDITLRQTELAILMQYLSQCSNFIVAGDFNTIDATSTSGADYQALMQPLLNAGYQLANINGTDFISTYNDSNGDKCLDNIVTSDNMRISNVYVDTTKKTDSINEKIDHMPLIATITVL